jgi:hypothetical protein
LIFEWPTPSHHYKFALPGVVASADDRLGVSGSDVPVGRDDADVVCGAAHMEVLRDLLFIEEGVVATAHGLFDAEN